MLYDRRNYAPKKEKDMDDEEKARHAFLTGPVFNNELFRIDGYVSIFIDLLTSKRDDERMDVRKYILVTLIDLIDSNPVFLSSLIANSAFTTVLQSLVEDFDSGFEVLRLLSFYNIVYFISQPAAVVKVPTTLVVTLFETIGNLSHATTFNLKSLAMEYFVNLIEVKAYRSTFLQMPQSAELTRTLFENLSVSPSSLGVPEQIQYQYRTLLSILLLTYTVSQDPAQLRDFHTNFAHYYSKLIALVKISIKEKIIRLIIGIFQTLTSGYETVPTAKNVVKQLILIDGFHPVLNNLKQRKWTDLELIDDLENLSCTFEEVAKDLTSFDEYLQELKTKTFRNSPVHSNETFFVEHLEKFQNGKYSLFKQLLSLLTDEEIKHNPTALVLILGDITKILKLDDRAVDIVNDDGRKLDVMSLLAQKDTGVKFAALSVTQVLVSKSLK